LDRVNQYPITDGGNLILGQQNIDPGVRNPFLSYNANEPEICRNIMNYVVAFLDINGVPLMPPPGVGYQYLTTFPAGTCGFQIEIVEPVFLSPLIWECKDQVGFIGLTQYNVQYIFSNLNALLAGSMDNNHGVGANTWTNFSVTLAMAPELEMNYLTPQPTQSLPNLISYPLYDTERYVKDIGPFDFLVTNGNVISDSITFHSIPDRFLGYMRKNRSAMIAQPLVVGVRSPDECRIMEPDIYLVAQTINIQWQAVAGLLSSMNQVEIYHMLTKNNNIATYQAFKNYGDHIHCYQFGEDIVLGPQQAPSQLGNGFQFQMTFNNVMSVNPLDTPANPAIPSPGAVVQNKQYQLFIVPIYSGVTTVANLQTIKNIGVLSQEAILKSHWAPSGTLAMVRLHSGLTGGSFWGTVKRIVHRISPVVARAAHHVAKAAESRGLDGQGGARRHKGRVRVH